MLLVFNNGLIIQFGYKSGSLPLVNRYYTLPVSYTNTSYFVSWGFIISGMAQCLVTVKELGGFYTTVSVRECNQDYVITIGY